MGMHLHLGKACFASITHLHSNTLRRRQNGHHFADDTFNRIFLHENVRISIKISLKFAPKGPINNIPALVQIMAWRHPGDKPLSEPMLVSLLMHICVTRPQWAKPARSINVDDYFGLKDINANQKLVLPDDMSFKHVMQFWPIIL